MNTNVYNLKKKKCFIPSTMPYLRSIHCLRLKASEFKYGKSIFHYLFQKIKKQKNKILTKINFFSNAKCEYE